MDPQSLQSKLLLEEKVRMLYTRYPITPDQELLLWEEWMTIRKEETTNLGTKTIRPPTDLTMNLLYKVRRDKEVKTVLEHAQIKEKPCFRGGLWEQAYRLKQYCYCQPVYEVQRTPVELGVPEIIEHIGVPLFIQETEMGVIGVPERKACTQLNADCEKYRKRRQNELQANIRKIDPYSPKIDELLIVGAKPKLPPPLPPLVPDIKETPPFTGPREPLCGVYALKINNTVLYKDVAFQSAPYLQKMQREEWHDNCYTWTYYFNVPLSRIGRGKLFLQNLGTVTLRYCWKRIKRPIPYIPEELNEQFFYFNKNEDVISPGQSKELLITFVSDRPGIYSEFWELSMCNIYFFDALGTKLIIDLYADAYGDINRKNINISNIMAEIDLKAVCKMVKDLVVDAIEQATTVQPLIYPYKKLFLEAELFIMKNPVCFYHQTEVLAMSEKYTEMCGEVWDLSVAKWREAMIDKEFDDRMNAYDFLKKSYNVLLKPWYEGDGLVNEKLRAVKLLLGQLAEKFDFEFMRISELCEIGECGAGEPAEPSGSKTFETTLIVDPVKIQKIHNIFFLIIQEHIAYTIELCAGVLSSLDLNRWIEFDFCQW